MSQHNGLSHSLTKALDTYIKTIGDGEDVSGLWATIMTEVEGSLIAFALTHTQGNKTVAAQMLGLSRNTLYKKMSLLKISG